jgi:hypothetical protein
MSDLKCGTRGCEFLKHSDINNNGGTHCCLLCKNEGRHGPLCESIFSPDRFNVFADTVYGFLETTFDTAFEGISYSPKYKHYRFIDDETASACISALSALAYGGVPGIGTTNDYVAVAGDKLIDMRHQIKLVIGDKAPILVFRKMKAENHDTPFYFVVQNLGGASLAGSSSNKFAVGVNII